MANPSTVETLLGSIPDQTIQVSLKSVFRYFLTNILFGRATGSTQSKASTAVHATNLGGFYFLAKTPSSVNTEFTVPHNLGRAPYLSFAVLALDQVNSSLPRLVVSRAADTTNCYFTSPDASYSFYLYVEG